MSTSSIINDCAATAISWQPTGHLIAIAWADGKPKLCQDVLNARSLIQKYLGTISCYSVEGRSRPVSMFSNGSQSNSETMESRRPEITVLKWSPSGRRLITGDKVHALKQVSYFNYFVFHAYLERRCNCVVE